MSIQKTYEKAIRLSEFIKFYIPKGYREPIHIFDYVPSISESDYVVFESAYNNGTLLNYLKSYTRRFASTAILPFNKPYVIEAIEAYFDKETL